MIVVVGLSHHTTPLAVREQLAKDATLPWHTLKQKVTGDPLREALFLSTCNRIELFAATPCPDTAIHALEEYFLQLCGETPPPLYTHRGESAIRHIFRVTASLDSMIVGEPQILGQIKTAYNTAQAEGLLGPLLHRCMTQAFAVAKRIRSQTALGVGALSFGSLAVDLSESTFGDLACRPVLLVGAGEMAESMARSFTKTACTLHVCTRTPSRGQSLANTYGATLHPWETLEKALHHADVVLVSTASPQFVITEAMMKRVMQARAGKTLLFLDLAVPRNVEPSIHALEGVYVFNLDDLQQQVQATVMSRQKEVAAAESMVNEEITAFAAWNRARLVQPTLTALRNKVHTVLLEEVERTLDQRLRHLSTDDRKALIQMLERAANKLLHPPTTKLKEHAGGEGGALYANTLHHLFDLPAPCMDLQRHAPEETNSLCMSQEAEEPF